MNKDWVVFSTLENLAIILNTFVLLSVCINCFSFGHFFVNYLDVNCLS